MANSSPKRSVVVAAAAFFFTSMAGACGDDPFAITWISTPDTTLLYSLARPELNLPTAFDLYDRLEFAVEVPGATDQWDLVVDTRDGQLVMLAPGALNITNKARITVIPGVDFEDVTEAPADTAVYTATGPLPLSVSNVYVIRTREQSTRFGFCSLYAKMQPIELDQELQRAYFVFDNNPRCEDRSLRPDQERES